jgi:hypothetical protein
MSKEEFLESEVARLKKVILRMREEDIKEDKKAIRMIMHYFKEGFDMGAQFGKDLKENKIQGIKFVERSKRINEFFKSKNWI